MINIHFLVVLSPLFKKDAGMQNYIL